MGCIILLSTTTTSSLLSCTTTERACACFLGLGPTLHAVVMLTVATPSGTSAHTALYGHGIQTNGTCLTDVGTTCFSFFFFAQVGERVRMIGGTRVDARSTHDATLTAGRRNA